MLTLKYSHMHILSLDGPPFNFVLFLKKMLGSWINKYVFMILEKRKSNSFTSNAICFILRKCVS